MVDDGFKFPGIPRPSLGDPNAEPSAEQFWLAYEVAELRSPPQPHHWVRQYIAGLPDCCREAIIRLAWGFGIQTDEWEERPEWVVVADGLLAALGSAPAGPIRQRDGQYGDEYREWLEGEDEDEWGDPIPSEDDEETVEDGDPGESAREGYEDDEPIYSDEEAGDTDGDDTSAHGGALDDEEEISDEGD